MCCVFGWLRTKDQVLVKNLQYIMELLLFRILFVILFMNLLVADLPKFHNLIWSNYDNRWTLEAECLDQQCPYVIKF